MVLPALELILTTAFDLMKKLLIIGHLQALSADIKVVFSGDIFHSTSSSFFLQNAHLKINWSIMKG